MATRPPVGLPKLSRRSRILLIVGVVLLFGLITGSRLLDTYVNWLWFGEVGFRNVYTTEILTKLGLFLAVGVFVGGVVGLNLYLAYRSRPVFVPVAGPDDPVARYRTVVMRRMRLFGLGIPLFIALIAGASAQADWQQVQLFFNATSFGVTDPQFGHDIGFYAFKLPFFEWLLSWLFITTAISFIGAVVGHYLFGGIRLAGRGGQLSSPARLHLALVAGSFVLLKAVAYFFDRYELLFSNRNEKFDGASYTDLNAVLPAKLILLCIAVFCAAAFFAGAFMRNVQLPAIATVLLVLSSVLVGAAWPAVLEQFSVKPNAIEKEAQSIQRNIDATKQAYGLTEDKVQTKPYEGKQNVSLEELRGDQATLGNIRLLDPAVLAKTFTQLQQQRPFYGFPTKLDIDRYTVDGKVRDYIVAVRELNSGGLPENQRDWINRHLIYTHGNGFVYAEANKVNAIASDTGNGGYPDFKVGEIASNGKLFNSTDGIEVKEPRTYYGELFGADDYAIVGGRPAGSSGEYDTDTSQYTYTGTGGVSVGSIFNKLVFAANYGERNILFNSAIGDESKILIKRHPRDRVQAVAPWLTVDGDPYPAVVNGKIIWIVDGYTTLDNYPYAQKQQLGEATNDSLTTEGGVVQQVNRPVNYIRNSVKATVDAYDGTVTLYAMDEKDPVLKAWQGVFPGTVKPSSDISAELRAHFRYPEDLFKVQRQTLASYHVTNPRDFFSGVSFWGVPSDPTIDNVITAQAQEQQGKQRKDRQPPFYVLAGDPNDSDKVSFQLTSSLVRQNREFMASYVSVSSDPDTYGKISVLQLQQDAKGPQQIQTQFLTSDTVSKDLNILNQQKSNVVYGNLLTLPVGGGLLYVEPVYIERASQQTSYPQLSKVLVSFGDKVGYGSTLKDALDQVLTGAGTTVPAPTDPNNNGQPPSTTPSTPTPPNANLSPELQQAIKDMQSALTDIRNAQKNGNFTELGAAYQRLDDAIKRFDKANTNGGGSPSTPPPSSVVPSPTPSG
ncbi:UPF0182 protein [Lentzea sp. NBRC 105346]|uniref:UPF0182 family protein n=1 Tax=Lentzea sp. NBRC 105346 TaxID=3032205 RepID=UPI0024A1ED43|nr:UPF0182 family protein [Lentzea sp. NBRC 105346]GLZ30773.1 UPF0182 protein [Lentzea sp. NBRC 105346]